MDEFSCCSSCDASNEDCGRRSTIDDDDVPHEITRLIGKAVLLDLERRWTSEVPGAWWIQVSVD